MKALPRKRVALLAAATLAALLPTWTAASAHDAADPSPTSESERPWDAYNYSPSSRTVLPESVETTVGDVAAPAAVLDGQRTRLAGAGAAVTLDFGKEVGGIVSLHFA